jgi:hypothetical protein
LTAIGVTLDTEALSTDERRRIYKLRKKWTYRADGQDLRWNALGSRPGRTAKQTQGKLGGGGKNRRNEEESDPLLASILKKYGTPLPEDI